MRILLAGYYGFGNLGDEMLAVVARDLLRPRHQVTILRARRRFLPLLRRADCLFFAGGSLFQDATGRGLSVWYYALLALTAKLWGKKLFLVAQGLGPFRRLSSRWLTSFVFRCADFVSLRDTESAGLIGLRQYQLTTDLLFNLQLKVKPQRRREIVVNFTRPILPEYQPLYFAMQPRVDYGRRYAWAVLAGARLAVGRRLHFIILALLLGVPVVAINYDPKVESLCRRLQIPCVPADRLDLLPRVLTQARRINIAAERRLAKRSWQAVQEALYG
ncbi:polysaccharide pyruvyl transferase CsaB [Candidatus Termititenax persephonae]|uniref:Polysaccharide pyruvyl transferase CsaB n=1 Tax=Candidatus Termititenax persephonae TaxID=2218525 RepID=A0A388THB2_9BACT|nr:polysaccharide pyruvyl transferase CsaB [Candidatus Termititenax persephonae]